MYKHLPVILIACGILLMLGAFFFGASNALPFQDATPEQLSMQNSRSAVYRLMFSIGLLDVVAGACLLWVRKRKKPTDH
jgi:hypothetical protein